MNKLIQEIFKEIESSNKIVITRHFRPDGDAIGSTMGLREILRLSFPDKDVRVVNNDYSEYINFLGKEDCAPTDYSDYLGIVIDTGDMERVSNQDIFKCKKIIKIDHHIDIKPYGDISWVEEDRPSASEMIASFWFENKDKLILNKEAATCIYTGIVTDTGRFKFGKINSTTMNLVGILLDKGIDTQMLYARLELEDYSFYKFQSYVFKKMNITPNGVAWLYVDKKMQKKFNLSREQASESVSFMNSIKGSLIWLAFIDNPDKDIRVRLRSRFVTINKLAEKYSGGGHEMASGATVHSRKELKALVDDADKLLGEFKKNNSEWI